MDEPFLPESESMPEEILVLVKPELRPGERLLWAGRGRPRGRGAAPNANPLIAPLFAVGLCFLGGVLFAAHLGAFGKIFKDRGDEGLALMFGLLASGLGLVVGIGSAGGWWLRRSSRARPRESLYALTDRRAITWQPEGRSDAIAVRSYTRGKFKDVHRVEYPDGTGDVICNTPGDDYWATCRFEGVADVRRVEEIARHLFIGPGPEPGP